jgi:class 3 adenylate cyclase
MPQSGACVITPITPAIRAMSRSAGLRDEIAALNEGLEADFGVRLSVRIRVTTGQVVAGTDERLAAGNAVNVAARLEQAAAPGKVIIGPQTWRLVRVARCDVAVQRWPLTQSGACDRRCRWPCSAREHSRHPRDA